MNRLAVVAALALALGCRASGPQAPDSAARFFESPVAFEIAGLEDSRITGGGRLQELLQDPDPMVRARAATALGRMPFPENGSEVTRPLLAALFDPQAEVRAAAAFALGMRGDPSAADKLLFVALDYHESDRDGLARARAIESASKLDRPELRERILDGFLDSDPRARLETAQGTARWKTDSPEAPHVNEVLVGRMETETERDVLLYTLFALERRKAPQAKAVFLRMRESKDDALRLFATRGLAAIPIDDDSRKALELALSDRDWRARCEALVGLGGDPHPSSAIALATQDSNSHVRRCAWEALLAQFDREWTAEQKLEPAERKRSFLRESPFRDIPPKFQSDASLSAEASRYELMIPMGYGDGQRGDSEEERAALAKAQVMLLAGGRPIVSAGIARGLGRIDEPWAREILETLATHPDLALAGTAIEALARSSSERAFVRNFMGHPDNGLRLAAITALQETAQPEDLELLEQAYSTSEGEVGAEVRFNALRSLARIGGDEARATLESALRDKDRFVRRTAREELARHFPQVPIPAEPPRDGTALVPRTFADDDPTRYVTNPRVAIRTSRGTMVFELFPREAPIHVSSFLGLIETHFYDGTTFHRVVPDFVIQGGDRRGDGNGAETALRHEITPRKYVRGSLGMPRNEDWDSGGSQIFVTHRETPHLDGRYTIFGELREGFDVLDAIEVGDRILDVRRL
jgi:cyclophilin family peptidyl-prolyl cis-trans isomerase